MLITDHAIKRYKRRIGKKHSSKKNIYRQINRDLERDVQHKRNSSIKDYYILTTSRYQAVCYRNRVITILSLNEDSNNCIQEGMIKSV